MSEKVKLENCVGCRVCEMACSMHHTGVYSYKNSSIAIEKAVDGFCVSLKTPFTCDTCEGEGENNYQCIKYCFRAKEPLRDFIMEQGKGGE